MPRHKSRDPRNHILPIRFSKSEWNEVSERAGEMPMGQSIRQRALDNLELPASSMSPTAQPERLPKPTLEGGVPAPLRGETYREYERRLNLWSVAALSEYGLRSRLELATAALVRYSSTDQ
jgi:hypothetical protein